MAHLDLVNDVALLVFALLWAGAVGAVWRDARARVANPTASRAAVAVAALVPFAGALAWFCVRPPETLVARRELRLRLRLAELELATPAVSERGDAPAVTAPAAALVARTGDAAGVAA